jgi:hypothetical protein
MDVLDEHCICMHAFHVCRICLPCMLSCASHSLFVIVQLLLRKPTHHCMLWLCAVWACLRLAALRCGRARRWVLLPVFIAFPRDKLP